MVDRIRRPQEYEDLLTNLTADGPFESYKDALVFCACLGFKRDQRVPFEKTSEPISLQIFRGQFDMMVMTTLAIAATDDPMVMAAEREKEKVLIFEEYACGGLGILSNELGDHNSPVDETVLNLVLQEKQEGGLIDSIVSVFEK
jgi:dnd system-associated protein 4